MRLSRQNAERIVGELHTVIDRDVNMMNENGIIIASTDPDRIGHIHQGACRILALGLPELIIHRGDLYEGSMEGVNYPIVADGVVVGVVGITGPIREVEKYGQITRKMTEILMQELSVKERRDMDESLKNRFLSEWIENEDTVIDEDFAERGRRMHIDITVPRRILATAAMEKESGRASLDELRSEETARQKVKTLIRRLDPDSVYLESADRLILGVTARSDPELQRMAESLVKSVEEETGIRLAVGADDRRRSYVRIRESFRRAVKALRAARRTPGTPVRFYREIDLEIFIDEISELTKREYVTAIFPGYSPKELSEAADLLAVFYDRDGSVTEAAQQLHMHKNTLQYRLKRIRERTGHDPRSLKASPVFLLALRFYQEIRGLLDEET